MNLYILLITQPEDSLLFFSSGKNNTKASPAKNSPNGKTPTIRKTKRQPSPNIWRTTASTVQNANFAIPSQKVAVCISPVRNANTNSVMAVVKRLRWARNVVWARIVRNWACTPIIRGIVCFIWGIRSRRSCRSCWRSIRCRLIRKYRRIMRRMRGLMWNVRCRCKRKPQLGWLILCVIMMWRQDKQDFVGEMWNFAPASGYSIDVTCNLINKKVIFSKSKF